MTKTQKKIEIPLPKYQIEVMEFRVQRLTPIIEGIKRLCGIKIKRTPKEADAVKLRIWKISPSDEKKKVNDYILMKGDIVELEIGRRISIEW